MARFVLWQRVASPASIVGTIEAPDLVAAARYARALYDGSFFVQEWSVASSRDKWIATDADLHADVREQEAHTR